MACPEGPSPRPPARCHSAGTLTFLRRFPPADNPHFGLDSGFLGVCTLNKQKESTLSGSPKVLNNPNVVRRGNEYSATYMCEGGVNDSVVVSAARSLVHHHLRP